MARQLEIFQDGRLYEKQDDQPIKVTETQGKVELLIEALQFTQAETFTIALGDAVPPEIPEPRAPLRKTNQEGLELLTAFEGLHALKQGPSQVYVEAYLDPVNIWTIGWGCTEDVHEGMKITMAQAEEMLKKELEKFEAAVANAVQVQINDNQFSALVCFSYNVGARALFESTIAQQFLLYKWGTSCGYPNVAPPGRSNHQSGLAIDIDDHQGWRPYLERHNWKWFGPKDQPHFDYVGGGKRDIRGTAMLAFQKLWNQNHQNDKIGEDSAYGPQTEDRLNKCLVEGFSVAPWDDQPRVLRLSRPPMQGSDVRKLQEALKAADYDIEADGFFGAKTAELVKQFQTKQGLTVDGIVGPATFTKIKANQ